MKTLRMLGDISCVEKCCSMRSYVTVSRPTFGRELMTASCSSHVRCSSSWRPTSSLNVGASGRLPWTIYSAAAAVRSSFLAL